MRRQIASDSLLDGHRYGRYVACVPGGARGAHARVHKVRRVVEELVYARTEDGIVDGGALFSPTQDLVKPIAVIWVHGNGVNF